MLEMHAAVTRQSSGYPTMLEEQHGRGCTQVCAGEGLSQLDDLDFQEELVLLRWKACIDNTLGLPAQLG